MTEDTQHRACVDAWLARCERTRSFGEPAGCVGAFEDAFAAIWERAGVTLGEITLGAIVDRVLVETRVAFPSFAAVRLEQGGRLDTTSLRDGIDRGAVLPAVRFLLIELLSVIGSLTAEILTPALHAALANVPPAEAGEGNR